MKHHQRHSEAKLPPYPHSPLPWLTPVEVPPALLGNKQDVMFQMLGSYDVIGQRHTLMTLVTHDPFLPFHGSQHQKTTWRCP